MKKPSPILMRAASAVVILLLAVCLPPAGGQTSGGFPSQTEEGIAPEPEALPERERLAAGLESPAQTAEAAIEAWEAMRNQTQPPIIAGVLDQAVAVAIIPGLIKAGLVTAVRHGTGVMLRRQNESWSLPIFVSITGASIGAQLGAQASDFVLVFDARQNIDALLDGADLSLGVDATVAAGPAGATEKAATRETAISAYRRTEGLFAGVSLTGGVLTLDESATLAYYDIDPEAVRGYDPDESSLMRTILSSGERPQGLIREVPPSAQELQKMLR